MGSAVRLITEELYERGKFMLSRMSQVNRAAVRLRAIVSARDHGVNLVAKVFNISSNTLRSWVKGFANGDLAGLDYRSGRGRKSKISDEHKAAICLWLEEDSNLTLNHIVIKLKEVFAIESSKSAVHRVLDKLKMSYITPRPVHYKQDKTVIGEFKKKSRRDNGKEQR